MYMEMKKDRVKSEKDSKLLENKLKMLQTEELKAFKKFQIEKKNKEEWEAARQKTVDFKNELNHNKFQKKQETYQNSIKIKEMKEKIQKSLNDKKMMKFQENRLNNLQLKQKKIENEEFRNLVVEEDTKKNKDVADTIKSKIKQASDKRKQAEVRFYMKKD
jgi:hypothetical protein